MPENDVIITKDLNEVARIHSDPKYSNWKFEYSSGEYKFYSPTYQKNSTITFYHGGVEPDFDIDKLDVLKTAVKQQNENNDYSGFYMFGEENYEDAVKYAIRENSSKKTTTKGVVKITMPSDIRVYTVPSGSITRITKEQIQELRRQGYDVIAGNMLGKMEYVLLNKEKILNMEFQALKQEQVIAVDNEPNHVEEKNDTYVSLEELEPLLSEDGYMCFGHGTGRRGNSDEVVDDIFSEGLRTKDNSLYFTAVGLSTPTTEIKKQHKELGIPEPSIEDLKNQLNNWQHLNSKRIIIARLPIEYINVNGDTSDMDGERFGAFYIEEVQQNGKTTNYLDPKFIVGCYDAEKQLVRLNKNFERTLSESTINKLKEGYKKALQKTKDRLNNTLLPIQNMNNQKVEHQHYIEPNFDYDDNFDFPNLDLETSEISSKRG